MFLGQGVPLTKLDNDMVLACTLAMLDADAQSSTNFLHIVA